MRPSNIQTLIEQVALLFASFVWTVVVLAIVSMLWVYQDVQARWNFVLNAPPEALAQAAPPTATPSPTMTPWRGPGPTATPTVTRPPTPTATRVVQPPNILPETLNADEPTPIPLIVPTTDNEATEVGLEQSDPAPGPPTPLPTLISQQPDQNPPLAPTSVPQATPSDPSGAGIPTHLVIDSVGIDSVVVPVGWQFVEQNGRQYSIWQVADNAVGWHKTSARLGQPGNTVMTGHHNVKGEVFRDLVNVEIGDKVVVYAGDQKFEYQIELKTIVKEKGEPLEVRQRNAQWIAPTDDERLTFVTCWPYTNNTHRVIVVAKPI